MATAAAAIVQAKMKVGHGYERSSGVAREAIFRILHVSDDVKGCWMQALQ